MKEIYRLHSAVPSPLPRVVPKGGMTIGDRYFEEGVGQRSSTDPRISSNGFVRLS